MTESSLKAGLKKLIKNKKKSKREIEILATEALATIKEKNNRISLLERTVETYEKADREAMIGKLNV